MGDIVKEVVGTSFALVVGLSDNQQITFQSGFAEDEDDAAVHARIDRLTRIARRSQLLAEVPKLKEERAQLIDQQAQTRADEARLDADYAAEVGRLEALKKDTFDVGYNEHVRAGRSGPYAPRGAAAQAISGAQRDLEKMDAERKVVLQQREGFHKRIDLRVAQIDEKLAEAGKLEGT